MISYSLVQRAQETEDPEPSWLWVVNRHGAGPPRAIFRQIGGDEKRVLAEGMLQQMIADGHPDAEAMQQALTDGWQQP